MKQNFSEALIGALVLLLFGFLVVYAAFFKDKQNVEHGYDLMAYFDQIDGVTLGTHVKLAGVAVGSVHTIELDKKTYRARLMLRIRTDIGIPVDSQLEIVSEGLFGSKYISVVPGADHAMLKPHQEVEKTQSSMNLEGLINRFVTKAE